MKIRCTWYEPQFVAVHGGDLVRVDPGEVIEVPDSMADLLEQYEGSKFALADEAPVKAVKADTPKEG